MIWILVKNRRTTKNVLFCYAGYPLRLTHRSGVLDRSHWFCKFTYSFPTSPILPPCPLIIGPACCTNMKIWQSSRWVLLRRRSRLENSWLWTRWLQLWRAGQPTGQSIAANNQNQSSVNHSRLPRHCHMLRSCWGWLPSYVGLEEEVAHFLHSLTFSLTSGRFRFCKKRYLFRGADRVAPCWDPASWSPSLALSSSFLGRLVMMMMMTMTFGDSSR